MKDFVVYLNRPIRLRNRLKDRLHFPYEYSRVLVRTGVYVKPTQVEPFLKAMYGIPKWNIGRTELR